MKIINLDHKEIDDAIAWFQSVERPAVEQKHMTDYSYWAGRDWCIKQVVAPNTFEQVAPRHYRIKYSTTIEVDDDELAVEVLLRFG